MMNLKKILTGIFAASLMLPAFAAEIKLMTQPAGDGSLTDKNRDGIMDTVRATVLDCKNPNEVKISITGWAWTAPSQSIFEFQLPEKFKGKKVRKATLILSSNGPAHEKTPDIEVFYYLAPQANGTVESADATGIFLGILSKAGAKINPANPAKLDVTKAVQAASGTDTDCIGFRLKNPSEKDDKQAVIWRTCEFAEAHGANYAPTLWIEIE